MRSRTPLLLVLLALVTGGCAQAPRGDGQEPLRAALAALAAAR